MRKAFWDDPYQTSLTTKITAVKRIICIFPFTHGPSSARGKFSIVGSLKKNINFPYRNILPPHHVRYLQRRFEMDLVKKISNNIANIIQLMWCNFLCAADHHELRHRIVMDEDNVTAHTNFHDLYILIFFHSGPKELATPIFSKESR